MTGADEEFVVTHESVHPDDPIIAGPRWRAERDELRDLTAVVVDAWTCWIDTRKPEWAYEPEDPATEALDEAIGKLGRRAVPEYYDGPQRSKR